MSAKRKSFTSVAKPVVRPSPKNATKARIDESRTAVTSGSASKSHSKVTAEVISSDSQEDQSGIEDEESEEEADTIPEKQRIAGPKDTKPESGGDVDVEDTEMASPKADDGESDSEDASPTFGDLVRGTTSTTVDVPTTLAAQSSSAVSRTAAQPRSMLPPVTSTSLGTVLNQALKTDDRDLLESCLQVNDVAIIQNTINRMDSALACTLLTKLADRMHRRPGRALSLMRWMQWTLIAHGGTLVTQAGLVNKLDNLRRVLEERGRGLPKLLALKGKLEMLDMQMQYRRAIRNAKGGSDGDESENPDEPGVVYVEGEDEELKRLSGEIKALTNGTRTRGGDEDDLGGLNGIGDEDSEDDSDEEEEDDDLAEDGDDLTDAESLDEDSVDHDDVEEESADEDVEEDQDDEDSAPPAKMQKVSAKAGRRK